VKKIRSVTVSGRRWRLVWKSYLGHDAEGNEFIGRCYLDKKEIHVKNNMSYALTSEILIHEMLHAQNPKHTEDDITQDALELAQALKRAELLKDE